MVQHTPTPTRINAAGRSAVGGKGLLNGSNAGPSGRGLHSRGVGVSSGGKGKGKSNIHPMRRQRYVYLGQGYVAKSEVLTMNVLLARF